MNTTPDLVAASFAGAMYGFALDNVDINGVDSVAAANGGSINSLTNAVYTRDFGSMTNQQVANHVAANVIPTTGSNVVPNAAALQAGAAAYILVQLNAAANGTQGQTIAAILNLFSGLKGDATWGAAATAWNTEVTNADNYANNPANTARVTLSSAGSADLSYTLTTAATSATEGSSITFHLATANAIAGSHVTYTLAGVTASEVLGGNLTGSVTLGSDGSATIPVTLTSTAGQGLTGPLTVTLGVPSYAATNGVTTASVTLVETASSTTPPAQVGSTFILTTATDNLTGGSFNDTFIGTYAGGVATDTFSAADTINGGGGTNSLIINNTSDTAITPPDALWDHVSHIENLTFNVTGGGAQTLTTGAFFEAAFSVAPLVLTATTTGAGAITIDMSGVSSGTPYTGATTLTSVTTAGAQTITTGSGQSTVTATSTSSAGVSGALTINGIGLILAVANTSAGAETIGDSNSPNLISVIANSSAGAQSITSTSTSSVTVVATSASGAQTVTTGSGNDFITLSNSASGAGTVTGGAGADTIVLGTHTAVDSIVYSATNQGGNVVTLTANSALTAGDTVSGFTATTDLIKVTSASSGLHAAATGAVNGWNMTTDTVFVSTGTLSVTAGATTAAKVSAAIGTVTSSAGNTGEFAIQTAAGSGIYNLFQVDSVNAHAGAVLGPTDTISLLGTFTLGAGHVLTTANFTA